MNIEQFEQQSIAYLKGKLNKQEEKSLFAIINSNSSKKRHYEELKELLNAMSSDQMQSPDSSLSKGFYNMLTMHQLENEKPKTFFEKIEDYFGNIKQFKPLIQLSMVLVIALVSGLIGFQFSSNRTEQQLLSYTQKLESINSELASAQLKSASTTDRIQAINSLNSHNLKEETIINKLINKLLYDDNLHVRMAAGKSLSVFDSNTNVKPAIIKAIRLEKELLVQVTLIDILISLDKETAINEVYKIYESELSSPELEEIYKNIL